MNAQRLRVIQPCSRRWYDLDGTGSVRHCAACGLAVTDVSALSRRQVERLAAGEGRRCGRLLTTDDGRLVVRSASGRRWWSRFGRLAAGVLALLAAALHLSCRREQARIECGAPRVDRSADAGVHVVAIDQLDEESRQALRELVGALGYVDE